MSTITACPSCSGQLRVPDELLGRLVRCPVCQGTFTAAAANGAPPDPAPGRTEESPLWKQLSLDLDGGQPAPAPAPTPTPPPPPRPNPAGRPGLRGAVELTGDGGENAPPSQRADEPPRRSGSPPPPKGRRIERERDRDDDDDDDRRPRRGRFEREEKRRDTEPHRGVLVLVLGIISIASTMIPCLGVFVALPLGIVAWIMGHNDLRKIRAHEMDEEGQGMTQAGWICGIVGTILGSLVLLGCASYFGFMLWMASLNTRPAPPMSPPAPVQQQPF